MRAPRKGVYSRVERGIGAFSRAHFSDFRVIYFRSQKLGTPVLRIEGPEEIVGHGAVRVLSGEPPWAPRRLTVIDGVATKVLAPSVVKKYRILEHFIYASFQEDLIFQQLYGRFHGTKYLTDCVGEAEFFSMLHPHEQLASRTSALCARLTHEVPLLRDVPLETVVKIRCEDPGSFVIYREALGRIVKDHLNGREVTRNQAEEIYHEILEPELIKLKREAAARQKSNKARVLAKAVIPAAVVSVGVFSGLLPNQFTEVAKIVGATALLTQAAEALMTNRQAVEVQNHNLYFLLKLSEASELH